MLFHVNEQLYILEHFAARHNLLFTDCLNISQRNQIPRILQYHKR